jgi:hypothetical protein
MLLSFNIFPDDFFFSAEKSTTKIKYYVAIDGRINYILSLICL